MAARWQMFDGISAPPVSYNTSDAADEQVDV